MGHACHGVYKLPATWQFVAMHVQLTTKKSSQRECEIGFHAMTLSGTRQGYFTQQGNLQKYEIIRLGLAMHTMYMHFLLRKCTWKCCPWVGTHIVLVIMFLSALFYRVPTNPEIRLTQFIWNSMIKSCHGIAFNITSPPHKWSLIWSYDDLFVVSLHKLLNKQSICQISFHISVGNALDRVVSW